MHKRSNTKKHSTNNTQTQQIQVHILPKHQNITKPTHNTKQVKTTTLEDILK